MPFHDARQLERIKNEVQLHALAARMRRIIKPLAWGDADRWFLLVLERAARGSLQKLVREEEFARPETTWELVRILAEAASGFADLHTLGILHRDIACRNVLIDADRHALVCDLGYARQMASGRDYARATPLAERGAAEAPILWEAAMDPDTNVFSAASDVFMFGLMAWEALSRDRLPMFKNLFNRQELVFRLRRGERPEPLPEHICPPNVRDTISRCLLAQPSRRPTMSEVAEALKDAYVGQRSAEQGRQYSMAWEAVKNQVASVRAEVQFGVQRVLSRME
jgi:serine/threonine protein kinase